MSSGPWLRTLLTLVEMGYLPSTSFGAGSSNDSRYSPSSTPGSSQSSQASRGSSTGMLSKVTYVDAVITVPVVESKAERVCATSLHVNHLRRALNNRASIRCQY